MTSFLGMHSFMDSDMNRDEDFVQLTPCHLVINTFGKKYTCLDPNSFGELRFASCNTFYCGVNQ